MQLAAISENHSNLDRPAPAIESATKSESTMVSPSREENNERPGDAPAGVASRRGAGIGGLDSDIYVEFRRALKTAVGGCGIHIDDFDWTVERTHLFDRLEASCKAMCARCGR